MMEYAPVQFKRATVEEPVEFWVKTTASGQKRAYYWSRGVRKSSVSMDIALLTEAEGRAVRVSEPQPW